MKYANIIYNDVVNTNGVALSFYTQGCTHHCKGCFQPETWDFNGGLNISKEVILNIEYCFKNYKYDYLCLLGGEPLDNIDVCKYIIDLCKKHQPNIKVWMYTGYNYDTWYSCEIKEQLDVIVDGEFKQDLYDPTLKYRGSSNQNIWKKVNNEWINITNEL